MQSCRGCPSYIPGDNQALQVERFQKLLGAMVTEAQMARITAALAPIMN